MVRCKEGGECQWRLSAHADNNRTPAVQPSDQAAPTPPCILPPKRPLCRNNALEDLTGFRETH